MSTIKNKIKLKYTYLDKDFEVEAETELNKKTPTPPSVSISKNGSPNDIGIGEIATYYVSIVIGDGYNGFGKYTLADIIDECTEFIVGTLKINGKIAENQDLLNIEIELVPNTTIQLEYQCILIKL